MRKASLPINTQVYYRSLIILAAAKQSLSKACKPVSSTWLRSEKLPMNKGKLTLEYRMEVAVLHCEMARQYI